MLDNNAARFKLGNMLSDKADANEVSCLSLLRNSRQSDVRWDPFPYVAIENALDPELYASLAETFPAEDIVRSAMHVYSRDQMQALDVLAHPEVAPVWKDFARYHISPEFYQDLLRLFAPFVRQLYPWLDEEKAKPLEQFSVGPRDPKAPALPDVCLDCQPGLNHVTLDPATPRTAHLDAHNKLFTGLFYMRVDGDTSSGGDLLIHRLKNQPPEMDTPTTVPESQLEVVDTIPYRANTAIFFMNSPVSVHSVSVRSGTSVPRRLVNLVAGLYTMNRKGLFPSPPTAEMFQNTRFRAPGPAE
ncbi:MAG: hypothetical protein K8R87_08755 [Verrucomicrobia bacterium]|nr:hypothetical protein [Verrucomicrobiota bacterium]